MTTKELFFFDQEQLVAQAESLHDKYMNANPFPHIYIDDFIPPAVLDDVLEEFPSIKDPQWDRFKNVSEQKLANNRDGLMGPVTRHVLSQFNSGAMCAFLEKLTGIEGIIPDPYFWGGGMHQIARGGFLKVHADFNWHNKLQLHRRINLLLYLNKDWEEEYGGHLELWDLDMENCITKILPVFNRCAIFSTTTTSYHGHPEPLTCPEDRSRRSLAFYYYSQSRPEEELNDVHSTLFKERPGEDLTEKEGGGAKEIVKKFIPPIFIDVVRAIKGGN